MSLLSKKIWISRSSRLRQGFRGRVLALCVLAVVPIITIEIVSARDSAKQTITALRMRTDEMVNTAHEQYNDLLLQAQIVLDFVAAAPESSGPTPVCDAFVDSVRQRYNWITGVGIARPDGSAVCGEAARQHLSIADQPFFQQALASKTLTISDYHIGPISHQPIITVLKPVVDHNDVVTSVSVLGINLKAFNSFIASKKMADDVVVTIFDSTGTVLARYPDGDKFTGHNMSFHPLFRSVSAKQTGEYQGPGFDNISRFYAFRPFWGTSSYIAVGVLDKPVLAHIHQRLIWNLITVLITIAAAAAIGLIALEMLVVRPTQRLTRAARTLGKGKFEDLPELTASMPEMSEMLIAFQEMAISLRDREKTLTQSEAKTHEINRNLLLGEQIANAGYWRVDFPDQTVIWSDGTYRIFGVSPHNFVPTLETAIGFYHPDDRKAVMDAVDRAITLQRDFEFTMRVVRADGELRHVQSRGFCELGPSGAVQSIFGAIIDVTVQKETEGRLLLARHAAEAASRTKSNFLSSMSHELRTPLTSIIGFADLLLMRIKAPEARHYLTLQREAGQHLLMLINDILDHSKIEAGKLQLESIPFDIRHLVDNCIGIMANEARQRSLTLAGTVGIAIPQILIGDPNRLKQIVLNLISNALKFTEAGSVAIDVEPVGVAGDVMALRIAVTDTGCGIAEDKVRKLFRRFAQADISTTRQFGGTGLGLSISKELVEAMGGTIGVDSIAGKGSTFWFTLRLLAAKATQAAGDSIEKAATLQLSRILLAEDSQVNQLLFMELLQTVGHEVVAVDDGAAAVEAIKTGEKFDLILMDMQMPVMNGLVATKAIRAAKYTLPIIGITANAMQEDIDQCLASGMNGHLPKPIDIEMLVQTIDRVMAEKPAL